MPLDKVEVFDLIKMLVDELHAKMTDAATPGQITKSEWLDVAQKVGLKAFTEVLD